MTTITLSATEAVGSEISNEHFGINATASWQDFGNLKTSISNLIENGMEVTTIRYPGGVETELYFDITDYDNTQWTEPDGTERNDFIPMTDFMNYCVEMNIQPVIVIPISDLYVMDGETPVPNFAMEEALKIFVHEAMALMGDVGIAAFEIGNEYWGTMGATPYGDVASWIAVTVQEAIDEYNALYGQSQDPDILLQMWVDPNDASETPVTYEELTTRNQNMIDKIQEERPDALDVIDGVTAHFYFKDGKFADYGPNTEHSYENLDEVMSHMYDMQSAWEDATGREMELYITEWNTHHKVYDYSGIQQVAPILEMFSNHLLNGVDSMQLWAMQFNAAAIADRSGDTNFIGDFLILLQDKTVGMQAMDVNFDDPNLDVHAFTDGDKAVVFVTSLSEGDQSVALDYDELFPNVDDYALTSLDIDPDSVDGYYRSGEFENEGWDEHLEPDAEMLEDPDVAYTTNPDGSLEFDLDGYEIMMIEFDLFVPGELILGTNGNDILIGTDGDDVISASDGADKIYDNGGDDTVIGGNGKDIFYAGDGSDFYQGGGSNQDEIRYTTSDTGLTIDLTDSTNSTGIAYGDAFTDVERLRGTDFDDLIIGGAGVALLRGEDGDDIIIDGTEKNYLIGGYGADTFQMIAGDGHEDRIYDFTLNEDTLDLSLWGVGDLSQLTFTEGANGTYLLISFEEESVRLNGYSAADIAAFDETVFVFDPNAPTGDGVVMGTSDNDVIDSSYVDQDGDTINDLGQLIQAGDGSDTVFDGAGDDIVDGAAGRDYFFAGDGADAYDGGSDNKDELWYTTSLSGLTIDLGDASNSTGIAAGDTVTNVERVRGTNYDDVIIAGSGVTNIKGLSGNDLLIDSDAATKEYFTGGAGADTFRFVSGDGQEDRIYDFSVAEDLIDLSLWGVTSLDDLTISAVGSESYLIIEYGDERIRVDDYGSADIAAFDENVFIFA